MKQKKVIIIISGSIAAIKIPQLIRNIKAFNVDVQCIITENAKRMITKEVIEVLSENPILDMHNMNHIASSRSSDLLVVAPATANIIAKIAHGIADDLATSTILASNKEVIIFPAMNKEMWSNHLTQNNISILKNHNFTVIEPECGELACKEFGMGRMPEVEAMSSIIIEKLHKKSHLLHGRKALITAGPTREYIDDVRYITNDSSGMQGYFIADELYKLGCQITLISGPTNLDPPFGVHCIKVTSGQQMLDCVLNNLPADIFLSVAAVCDFKVPNIYKGKIKKSNLSTSMLEIKFSQTEDILHKISILSSDSCNNLVRPKLVIGFAMEVDSIITNAQKKLNDKKCDWIVVNSIKSINSTYTNLKLITQDSIKDFGEKTKKEASAHIANEIADFFSR